MFSKQTFYEICFSVIAALYRLKNIEVIQYKNIIVVLWQKKKFNIDTYQKPGIFARVQQVGISNTAEIPLFSGNQICTNFSESKKKGCILQ